MVKGRGMEFWRGHLAGWATSGLTQVAYCAVHGFGVDAFRGQLYAARGWARAEAIAEPESLRLVPVVVSGEVPSTLVMPQRDGVLGGVVTHNGVSPAPTGETANEATNATANETAPEPVSLRVRGASDWRMECGALPPAVWVAALMKALS